MYTVKLLRTHLKSKIRIANSVCSTVVLAMSRQDTTQFPELACYSVSMRREMYWNRDWAVDVWSNFMFCCKLLSGLYWPWPLSYSQVSAVHKRWSFLFRCSILAEGPSNGSVMARQTTLFGTVKEKGQFSRACLMLSTMLSTMQLLKRRRCWTAFIVCINNFLHTKQGMGVEKLWKS